MVPGQPQAIFVQKVLQHKPKITWLYKLIIFEQWYKRDIVPKYII